MDPPAVQEAVVGRVVVEDFVRVDLAVAAEVLEEEGVPGVGNFF